MEAENVYVDALPDYAMQPADLKQKVKVVGILKQTYKNYLCIDCNVFHAYIVLTNLSFRIIERFIRTEINNWNKKH